MNNKDEEWTLVVKPQTNWFQLHLKELWHYRDLVMLFVKRDFVSLYKQTILGPLWYIIQPILTAIMYSIVFGKIANIDTPGLPKFLFYLSSITIWNYFSESLNKTSNTFISNAQIFGKVYFPRLTVPISIVISSLIAFSIQLALFVVVLFYYYFFTDVKLTPNCYIFLLPLLVLIMAGIGLGVGIIISSLTTKYRDLRFLITFGIQLLMFATPVIYPLSSVLGKKRMVILANPLSSVIETFRYAFTGVGEFHWGYLAYSFAFMVVVLFVGVLLFNKVEKSFMDTV
jgi:lipopolysaccharide transport system permease protein